MEAWVGRLFWLGVVAAVAAFCYGVHVSETKQATACLAMYQRAIKAEDAALRDQVVAACQGVRLDQ